MNDEVKEKLKKCISSAIKMNGNILNGLIEEFDSIEDYKFELIKFPKWDDDALILKFKINDCNYVLKIHYDKYPIAANIYNSEELLKLLDKCEYCTHIELTFTCKNKNGRNIRCVVYPYICGETIAKAIQKCDDEKIKYYQGLLRECTVGLYKAGFNPFIKDLDDFMVTKKEGREIVVLTDYNTLFDCHNASIESRTEIMDIIDDVIKRTLTKNYKPYILHRPTLTDV